MEEHRQAELFGPPIDGEGFGTDRIEVLVVRSDLDPDQPKILGGTLDFLERARVVRVNAEEPQELVRMRLNKRRGVVIDQPALVHQTAVIDDLLARIGRNVENDRFVDWFEHLIASTQLGLAERT